MYANISSNIQSVFSFFIARNCYISHFFWDCPLHSSVPHTEPFVGWFVRHWPPSGMWQNLFPMKTPERSRTSHIGHFLVLSFQNSLFDVIMWCHMTSRLHTVMSRHRPCHSDGTRHLSIVLNYYVMKFYLVTKIIGQMIQPGECSQTHTDRKTAPILWPRPLTRNKMD